jgi:hypothetical protein
MLVVLAYEPDSQGLHLHAQDARPSRACANVRACPCLEDPSTPFTLPYGHESHTVEPAQHIVDVREQAYRSDPPAFAAKNPIGQFCTRTDTVGGGEVGVARRGQRTTQFLRPDAEMLLSGSDSLMSVEYWPCATDACSAQHVTHCVACMHPPFRNAGTQWHRSWE